jgi:RHS repeat-associated protein
MGQEGAMRDGESNLYYMRARFYDADSGRFISRDPSNQSVSPLETNPYSFARANPMMFNDPTGFNAKVIWDGNIHTDIAVEVWCGDEVIGILKLGFFMTAHLKNNMGPVDSIGALGFGAPSSLKGQFTYGATLGSPGKSGDNITIGGSREQDDRLTRQMLRWMGYDSFGNDFSPGEMIKSLIPRPKGKTHHTAHIRVNSTKSYGAYRVLVNSRVCNDFTDDSLDIYYGRDWSSWGLPSNRSAPTLFNELLRYENMRTNTNRNWLSSP